VSERRNLVSANEDLTYAREVVHLEIEALEGLLERLGEAFQRAVDAVYKCRGRVIVTGVGKAGIIGQKISATLASTGTPSHWVHAVEARHGDLGRVVSDDAALVLSNSGETEVVQLLPSLKKIGTPIIAITGHPESTLGRHSDIILDIGIVEEACPLGLAPSASTTAMLVLGDALALTVFQKRNLGREDYAFFHPGGDLGRRLILVASLMRTGEANPTAPADCTVRKALRIINDTPGSPGAVSLVDADGRLAGFFTDGDFRRLMQDGGAEVLERPVADFMTRQPKSVGLETLAAEAYRLMRQHRIDQVPVLDTEGRPAGLMDVQDWLDVEQGW